MGRFEVLEYMQCLRAVGDEDFYRYTEVHDGLREKGVSLSYSSVWRTMNTLWSDEFLEVDFEVEGLQRTAKFRARESSVLHSSQMKRVHNILQAQDEKGLCGSNGEVSKRNREKAQARSPGRRARVAHG